MMTTIFMLLVPAILCVTVDVNAQHQQQQQQYTTPVPILKQINRQNEDGSYSFGYEAADKSFKIETKYPNGEVYGKYGYVDDQGKVREVEYGASRRGFEPQGSDINVPPPTLNNDNNRTPLGANEQDDGQYREDPSIYYKDNKYNSLPAVKATPHRLTNTNVQQPRFQTRPNYQSNHNNFQSNNYVEPEDDYSQQYEQRPQYQPQPQYKQPQYQQQPQQQYQQYQQPQYQQPQYQQPQYQQTRLQKQPQYQQYQQPRYQEQQYQQPGNLFQGHPAEHIDINTGSYSLSYTG